MYTKLYLTSTFLLIAHQLLIAQAITQELRVKGAYFKVPNGKQVTLSETTTTTNISDAGYLVVQENGSFLSHGDVINAATGNIQIDGTLELKKGFTNNGNASLTLAGGSEGTVKFSGSVSQTIDGSTTSIYENFEIDNSNGVSLSQNIDISKTLTFTNGIITTGASRVELSGTDANYVSGSGDGKYILGNLRRYATNSVTYTLPIGTATYYEEGELFVNSNTGLSYVDVVFTTSAEAVPPGLQVEGQNVSNFLDYGFWTLNPNAGTSAVNYNFTATSKGHSDLGGTQDNYALITDIGAGWQNLGPHSIATQSYSATAVTAKRQTLTAFGSYVVAYIAADLYSAPPVTTELLVKGAYFKIPANDTVFVKGSSTNVNNESGGTITIQGGLRMEGAWNNNANANIADAVFTFEGSGDQNFGTNGPLSVKGISMDKPSDKLILNNDITLSDQIKLLSGNIDLNGHSLILESTVSLIGSPSSTSHVIATNGQVIQKLPAVGISHTLPLGDGNDYTPFEFTLNSASGLDGTSQLAVSVTDAKHPSLAATEYITRYFTYTPTNINTPNYDVTIHYTDADVVGDESTLSFAKYSAGSWSQNLGVFANTAANTLSFSGATSFSDGTGAKDGDPLPVELINFEVALNNHNLPVLKWRTASEINNSHFEIEKSTDAQTFQYLGTMEGAGTSFSPIEYTFIDHSITAVNHLMYYRIKQVDLDGSGSYTPIRTLLVQNQQEYDLSLFPNPTSTGHFSIHGEWIKEAEAPISISIMGSSGNTILNRVISPDEIDSNVLEIHVSLFTPGTYLVSISTQNKKPIVLPLIIL